MRSENPSLTQKSEGLPVAQGSLPRAQRAPATLPEGPCYAPRVLLPLALKTTGRADKDGWGGPDRIAGAVTWLPVSTYYLTSIVLAKLYKELLCVSGSVSGSY